MADLNAIKDLVVCSFKGTTPDPTEFSTKRKSFKGNPCSCF